MLAKQMPAPRTAASLFLTFVTSALLLTLTGCSIQQEKQAPTETSAPVLKTPEAREEPPRTPPPVGPCVYESTKGIAEVTKLSAQQVTFKFYPGDQYFKLPVSDLPEAQLDLGQELKAIIRRPLAGPCHNTEFELLSTVD